MRLSRHRALRSYFRSKVDKMITTNLALITSYRSHIPSTQNRRLFVHKLTPVQQANVSGVLSGRVE